MQYSKFIGKKKKKNAVQEREKGCPDSVSDSTSTTTATTITDKNKNKDKNWQFTLFKWCSSPGGFVDSQEQANWVGGWGGLWNKAYRKKSKRFDLTTFLAPLLPLFKDRLMLNTTNVQLMLEIIKQFMRIQCTGTTPATSWDCSVLVLSLLLPETAVYWYYPLLLAETAVYWYHPCYLPKLQGTGTTSATCWDCCACTGTTSATCWDCCVCTGTTCCRVQALSLLLAETAVYWYYSCYCPNRRVLVPHLLLVETAVHVLVLPMLLAETAVYVLVLPLLLAETAVYVLVLPLLLVETAVYVLVLPCYLLRLQCMYWCYHCYLLRLQCMYWYYPCYLLRLQCMYWYYPCYLLRLQCMYWCYHCYLLRLQCMYCYYPYYSLQCTGTTHATCWDCSLLLSFPATC